MPDTKTTKEEKCNAEKNGVKCRPPCKTCYGGAIITPSTMEERFRQDFELDGVTYKGQRHWKDEKKYQLVEKFIRNEIESAMNMVYPTGDFVERFNKKFPYKIQGSPKHTPLRFIGKEVLAFLTEERRLAQEELLRKIGADLLKKARVTDYADNTEYDELYLILDKYAKKNGFSLTNLSKDNK